MKILQGGAPKCGNFWLYQIIEQILKRSKLKMHSFIERQPIYTFAKEWELNFPDQAKIDVLEVTDLHLSYRISSIFRMPIDNLKSYVSQTTHVWTHSPICKRSGEVFDLFDKKVYIVRDPRDRAISASKYYCSDYMLKYFPQEERDPKKFLQKNFEILMTEWVWHVWDHLRLRGKHNIHIAFFEGFKMDFLQELELLLDYLEIDLPKIERLEIEKAVLFDKLQKKNPKHLKRGESGYWMDELTDEQLEKASKIAGPMIDYLGYPSGRDEPVTFSRVLLKMDFEELKQKIIAN